MRASRVVTGRLAAAVLVLGMGSACAVGVRVIRPVATPAVGPVASASIAAPEVATPTPTALRRRLRSGTERPGNSADDPVRRPRDLSGRSVKTPRVRAVHAREARLLKQICSVTSVKIIVR